MKKSQLQEIASALVTINQATTSIASILAGVLGETSVPQASASVSKPAQVSQLAKSVPAKTPASRPAAFVAQGDENTVPVSVTSDGRVKLPKRLFVGGKARVDGIEYRNSSADGGRVKVQASVFGASIGETVTLRRQANGTWLSGGAKRTSAKPAPVVSQPAAKSPAKTPAKPALVVPAGKPAKNASKPAQNAKSSASAPALPSELTSFLRTIAKSAAKNAGKGRVKEFYSEGDVRRHLRTSDRSLYNKTIASFRVSHAVANAFCQSVAKF